MATEQGLVIKTLGAKAIVKTQKTEACDGCASRDSCSTQGRDMEVEVINSLGAKEGDRVILQIETRYFLKATFLMYIFPIVCLIAGAFIGERVAIQNQGDPSGYSAGFGFGFFLAAIFLVKMKGNKMGEKDTYKPRITRIVR
ncbi:MAG: SoxR reducing system RseC family protein [Proteobacteria bacterium]|nr:SoxR reducing system RseC family protein [Pseudomonadota bacterium]